MIKSPFLKQAQGLPDLKSHTDVGSVSPGSIMSWLSSSWHYILSVPSAAWVPFSHPSCIQTLLRALPRHGMVRSA